MVHGDDFASVGTRQSKGAFKCQMEKHFDIKTQVIGSRSDARSGCRHASGESDKEVQERRVVNTSVRWTNDGWEIEPDERHADIIVHELGLDESKPVATPGEVESRNEGEEEGDYWTPVRHPSTEL